MRPIHHVTRFNPFEACRVADMGDVRFSSMYDPASVVQEIESFFNAITDSGVVPLSAGGDHSITYPILKALGRNEPVGLIHVDAHTDTWGPHQGCKFHHGAPFRLAVEDGVLDPLRTVQIGIRGTQTRTDGWDFSEQSGMRVIFMEEFTRMGVGAVIAEARRVVGDGPTYVSFDVDGLDPVYAPGTGTPEIGGITTIEAQALLRGLNGLNLVGGDVVEVSPPFDPTGNTALVAATLMFEILCLLAESKGG
jgi:guanidinopropionase